eukprot:329501-Chlamydomonas_euryale.AAC.1
MRAGEEVEEGFHRAGEGVEGGFHAGRLRGGRFGTQRSTQSVPPRVGMQRSTQSIPPRVGMQRSLI